MSIWNGSNLAAMAAAITKQLAAAGVKLPVAIGPSEDALAMAPPRIVIVDGDDVARSRFTAPREQPDEGKAIWDRNLDTLLIVRGEDVRRAEELQEAVIRAMDALWSRNVYTLGQERRKGGGQSEEGFTLEMPLTLRWPVFEQAWIQDAPIEGWEADGFVEAPEPAPPAPELIVEQEA
jgi:hypothetical protein